MSVTVGTSSGGRGIRDPCVKSSICIDGNMIAKRGEVWLDRPKWMKMLDNTEDSLVSSESS